MRGSRTLKSILLDLFYFMVLMLQNKTRIMTEEEVLLSSTLNELGAKAVLSYIPTNIIEHARKRPTFASFGVTELAHVLSFTYIADTLSVMLVCKQWYAATQRQHFWLKRIERAKRAFLSSHNFTQDPTAAVMAFDTFSSPVAETLRCQIEWLFATNWLMSFIIRKTGQETVRRITHLSTCVCQFYIDKTTLVRSWMKSIGFHHAGLYISETLRNGSVVSRMERPTASSMTGTLCGQTEHGHYNGEGIEIGDGFHPHGTGKWTFDDGEVLEGPGVAFEGEPRMPYKKLKL